MLQPERIVGSWRLVRWEVIYGGERRTLPFGPDATGLLTYTADGAMSACIMAAGRVPFSAPNPRDTPAEERACAYDGYFGYAGTWRVKGRRVLHDVTIAANPGMVGTTQVRDARLHGRRLELSALETVRGVTRFHRLVWERPRPTRGRKASPESDTGGTARR
jgi:hypothetical protein